MEACDIISCFPGDEVIGPLSEALEPESLAAGISPANQRTAASPDLALSLPASRNFEPRDFASMLEAVFPSRQQTQGKPPPQRVNRRRAAEGLIEPPSRQQNLRARLDVRQPRETLGRAQGAAQVGVRAIAAAQARVLKELSTGTAWITQTSALQAPSALDTSSECILLPCLTVSISLSNTSIFIPAAVFSMISMPFLASTFFLTFGQQDCQQRKMYR